jgi:hypothetical protein
MKKLLIILLFTFYFSFFTVYPANSQCSICTRTAEQLGKKPAQGLNAGILYLAFAPFALAGFIAFRWWKKNN